MRKYTIPILRLTCFIVWMSNANHLYSVPKVENGYTEFQYATITIKSTNTAMTGAIIVTLDKSTIAKLSKQRNADVSKKHLVLQYLNSKNKEIWRQVILDPRIISGHSYGDTLGEQAIVYLPEVNFTVLIPRAHDVQSIIISKPEYLHNKLELTNQVRINVVQSP